MTVVIGANGLALVTVACAQANTVNGFASFMSFELSGANTLAASDSNSVYFVHPTGNQAKRASATVLLKGLAAGSTTFTAKYRGNGNTASFDNRHIAVIPL